MKQDFFNSLQDQLEQAGDCGEPPHRRRWRALRRWLRRHRAPLGAAMAIVGLGVIVAVIGNLTFSGTQAGKATKSAGLAAEGSAVSGSYASDDSTFAASSTTVAARSLTAGSSTVSSPPVSSAAAASAATVAAGTTVPLSFTPYSFTALSEYDWWMLGESPCSRGHCLTIVRTLSGGYSFVSLPAPVSAKVDQIRFVNQQDGYLFGSQLWSTSDGGEHWQQVRLSGEVTALAAAGRFVFATVELHGAGQLWRAAVGAERWRRIVRAGIVKSLWTQGNSLLIDSQASTRSAARLLISGDYGTSFQAGGSTSSIKAMNVKRAQATGATACDYDETLDQTIWASCASGEESLLYRSTDSGAHFTAAGALGASAAGGSSVLAAASATIAVVGASTATDSASLRRTTNGGRTWAPVTLTGMATGTRLEQVSYVGFTDATHGVAIVELSLPVQAANGRETHKLSWQLLYTTDAGASYHYVPITD